LGAFVGGLSFFSGPQITRIDTDKGELSVFIRVIRGL